LLAAASWVLGGGRVEAAPRQIVILAGALDSHPPGTHEYEKSALLLQHCLTTSPSFSAEPPQVEVCLGGWPQDPQLLEAADTIVFLTAGCDLRREDHPLLAGDHLADIERHMKRGAGLVLLHWSTF